MIQINNEGKSHGVRFYSAGEYRFGVYGQPEIDRSANNITYRVIVINPDMGLRKVTVKGIVKNNINSKRRAVALVLEELISE